MEKRETAPTFEEYKQLVKAYLVNSLSQLDEAAIDAYLNSEDDFIHESYDRDMKEYEAGKITAAQVRVGGASGLAHALDLMY